MEIMQKFSIQSLIIGFLISISVNGSDDFIEELYLRPLGNDHLSASFNFVILANNNTNFHHADLLPHSLGEVISRFKVDELHFSLTEGQWRHRHWGYPINDAPPGAELYAWFNEDTDDVDKEWKKLAETLSGLFCASLNFIDSSNTISPKTIFYKTSPGLPFNSSNERLRYASLPREIVCTENLTPWKKLLPCSSDRGLATLLNSRMIHNTNYHSLGVHYRKVCADKLCTASKHEIKLTVSLAFDLIMLGYQSWSFRKLFGLGLAGRCPLASKGRIYVEVEPESEIPYELVVKPSIYMPYTRSGVERNVAIYDLDVTFKMLNVAVTHKSNTNVAVPYPPYVHFNRYIVGYGQEYGGIVTDITNNYFSYVNLVLLENAPWWLPLQLSSLRVNGQPASDIILSQHFSPGRSRSKPYHLELVLKLPPKSTTKISIDFEFVFLKWQEYPPDANHGFYIGSGLISVMLPSARNYTSLPIFGSTFDSIVNASQQYYVGVFRTQGAAISLPTPDFSMPYNVICLACTVVALAFGPLHNICTKRLILQLNSSNRGYVNMLLALIRRKQKTE